MTDLQVLEISLRNQNGPLPIQAVRLHVLRGVFYNALGGEQSPLARAIHSKGADGRPDPAPYSIGPLFVDGHLTGLRIATMQDCTQNGLNLAQVIFETWETLKGRVITVGPANMEVLETAAKSRTTYEKIWDEAEAHYGLQLRFEMPARFSHYGRDHLLPIPRVLWQFYLLRWDRYSGLQGKIPPEFLTWIEHQVHVMDVNIETRLAYIEGTSTLSGVMGDVTYQAFREKKPPKGKESMVPESQLPNYLRAWRALAALAHYCGTGENASIGMGRTQVVSFFGPYQPPIL